MRGRCKSGGASTTVPQKKSINLLASSVLACSIFAIGFTEVSADGSASSAVFSAGVVAAAHPLAAEVGAKVLEAGGNAVDAAVATQFTLNVVEPTSSGIGGGGFMGIYLAAEDRLFFIDSREKAPAASTPTQFLKCGLEGMCTGDETFADALGPKSFTDIATSGIGVGVPGTLLGAAQALERYGSISLSDALAPAIKLAEEGFAINQRLAKLTESARTTFWPETSAKFRTKDGQPLSEGFLLIQPNLARTFKLIAEGGVEAFYSGEIANAIVSAQRRSRETVGDKGSGRMSLGDLANYLADYQDGGISERDPIIADYRGYQINGMPPPSSGGLTVAQILACMERFDIGNVDDGFGSGSPATLHVMVEAMRLAFSSRSVWMGDTDHVTLPVDGLTNAEYLAERCELISLDSRIDAAAIAPGDPRQFDKNYSMRDKAEESITEGAEGKTGVDTTHFTVRDADGNVVTWTSTIEGTWGSGMTVPGYGFLLNNELTDFNFIPQANDSLDDYKPGANDVAPNKRPRSSMAPTMIFKDGQFVAAFGSPGGSTIINTVVNVTANLIDHGMTVQEAIDAPRISSSGGKIRYEEFDKTALTALTDLGHTLRDSPSDIGSVQAVMVDGGSGAVTAGADHRRAGTVVGLPR